MEYNELETEAATYQSNIRAEDGLQLSTNRNTLFEYILIPLGSVFTVVLAILGVMLLNK
jgi:hypothetical protein